MGLRLFLNRIRIALFLCFALITAAEASELSTIRQLTKQFPQQDLAMLILEGKEEFFSLNGNKKLTPASVTKAITGAAVLELLGPGYPFRTQLLYDGSILENSIRGAIYLRGGGDPSFHSGRLSVLLDGLKKRNIQTIEGNLIIDDSRFDDVTTPDWQSRIPTLNEQLFPLYVRLDPVGELHPIPSQQQKLQRVQRKLMNLEGRFVVYQNNIEPDLYTGELFLQMLRKSKIELKGEVRRGKVSKSSRVLSEIVTSSDTLVHKMMKSSNNYYADLLVRNLAYEFGERPATFETGIHFVKFYLDYAKIPRSLYSLNSGSGFSHQNKISPVALAALLNHLKSEKSVFPYFQSSLPVAGVDGTLRGRMKNTPAQNRVRAKTGYLRPVSTKTLRFGGAVTLAGFASHPNGKQYTFAFLYNGLASPDTVRRMFDNVCIVLTGGKPAIATKSKKKPAKAIKRRAKK